jgi:proteasome activator subunit 4
MLRSSKLSVFSFAFEYSSGRSRRTIAKMSQGVGFENMLNSAEQLLWDADRFKQRAGAEMLAGITRGIATFALIKVECDLAVDNIGAKNWPKQWSDQLWSWVISRLDRIYTSIKPDTIGFWEATFSVSLCPAIRLTAVNPSIRHYWKGEIRDVSLLYRIGFSHYHWISMAILPLRVRRTTPMPYGTSPAPLAIKTLTIFGCFLDNVGYRDVPLLDRYFALLLEGTDVSFAEVAACTISARPLVDFSGLDQGFHICKFIHDRNEALEAVVSIS